MTLISAATGAALLSLGLAVVATPAAKAAAADASFVVVHGIPGRDVAPGLDPLLPVDVLVGGQFCLLKGFTFGEIAGPFDVPPGTYKIAVSLANPISPCSGTPVITASATLTSGEFGAVVAALSTKGAPTAEIYPVDVSPVGKTSQRLIAAHAADAPAVEVTVKGAALGKKPATFQLAPGAEKAAPVPEGTYSVTITPLVAGAGAIGPFAVAPGHEGVALLVAVGSAASGSVTVLSKILPDVH